MGTAVLVLLYVGIGILGFLVLSVIKNVLTRLISALLVIGTLAIAGYAVIALLAH